jgi:hypothetical protein
MDSSLNTDICFDTFRPIPLILAFGYSSPRYCVYLDPPGLSTLVIVAATLLVDGRLMFWFGMHPAPEH